MSSAASTSATAFPAPVLPSASSARPSGVGIHAIDMYFPRQFVAQSELEQFNQVAAGKYTIGLGQTKMAFCTDREDIYSVCLSGQTNTRANRQRASERTSHQPKPTFGQLTVKLPLLSVCLRIACSVVQPWIVS